MIRRGAVAAELQRALVASENAICEAGTYERDFLLFIREEDTIEFNGNAIDCMFISVNYSRKPTILHCALFLSTFFVWVLSTFSTVLDRFVSTRNRRYSQHVVYGSYTSAIHVGWDNGCAQLCCCVCGRNHILYLFDSPRNV